MTLEVCYITIIIIYKHILFYFVSDLSKRLCKKLNDLQIHSNYILYIYNM